MPQGQISNGDGLRVIVESLKMHQFSQLQIQGLVLLGTVAFDCEPIQVCLVFLLLLAFRDARSVVLTLYCPRFQYFNRP